jgi:hypothetical protein
MKIKINMGKLSIEQIAPPDHQSPQTATSKQFFKLHTKWGPKDGVIETVPQETRGRRC